ncbi:MAG: AraC family transcriptional regulator [Pseudomonadota bacterium]
MLKQAAFVRYLLATLILVSTSLLAKEETKPSDEKQWAESIETQNTVTGAKYSTEKDKEAIATLKRISGELQALKSDVVTLNKDLRVMEEKLLFPSSTKYSVFVSMSSGQFFTLESVKLKLNGKLVTTHLYSESQREALSRGGVQRLYVTNINEGKHTATAFFTGIGPNGRTYKRAQSLDFVKGPGSEYLELIVSDNGSTQEPQFRMKQW